MQCQSHARARARVPAQAGSNKQFTTQCNQANNTNFAMKLLKQNEEELRTKTTNLFMAS